jgi:hypothetical protein
LRGAGPVASIVGDVKEIKKSDNHYETEESYFTGEGIPEVFSNPRTARILRGVSEKYRFNLCAAAVRPVLGNLEILGLRIVDAEGEFDQEAQTNFSRWVERPAKLDQQLEDAIKYALEFGDSFLIADPQMPGELDQSLPVYARNPIGARAFYQDENPTQLDRVVTTWLVPSPAVPDEKDKKLWLRRVNVMELHGIMRWISTVPHGEIERDDQYEPYEPEPVSDETLLADDGLTADPDEGDTRPGFVPNDTYDPVSRTGRWYVVHLRTARPYGISEHAEVHGAQNLMTKAVTTLAESLDGFALPYRYEIRKSATALASGSDTFTEDDDDDRATPAGSAGELGVHWDADSVGQLTPADVNNLIEPIELVMRLAASVSATPLDYFDASAASASGESKREHREALNNRVGTRRRDFGREISDMMEFLLELLGYEDHGVKVVWKPLEQADPKEQFETIQQGLKAGMPWPYLLQTVLDLDPSEITADDWPDPRYGREASVDILVKVAQALQHLGAAATLGTVTSDTVDTLVTRALSGSDESGEDAA